MEKLIKRLRELQTLTEHCSEQLCYECKNKELCNKYDNKTLNRTYKEAADAIEELSKYADAIRKLKHEGWYLQQTKYHDGYQAISTMPLPKPQEE